MNLGVLFSLKKDTDILQKFKDIAEMDLQSCQITVWDTTLYTEENAAAIRAASEETGVVVSTLWAGWSGPTEWNFTFGPVTLGLVPAAYRGTRLEDLKKAIPFAEAIGTKNIATHVGFLPTNPRDPDYIGTIGALRHLCMKMKEKGLTFLFETGQETPVTLLRAIEDIGYENVGINFDTANVILYGMANAQDSWDTFGKYVRDMHIKDGLFPTEGNHLGKEVPVGEGKVDFPQLIQKLRRDGYEGFITIEREIKDGQHAEGIAKTRDFLRSL